MSTEIELLRTLLLLIAIGYRVGELTFGTDTFSVHYPTHASLELSAFSYGQLTIYDKFVSRRVILITTLFDVMIEIVTVAESVCT